MFNWLSFIERNCVGEENVKVNYAFFQRGGVHICMCVCGGWATHTVCSPSICRLMCECVEKQKKQFVVVVCTQTCSVHMH